VDFRDFDRSGLSLFEVEFVGGRGNFNQFLQSAILTPLNKKLGEEAFSLESTHGGVVRLSFRSRLKTDQLIARLQGLPPAGLTTASGERLKDVVKSEETMKKVSELSPDAAKRMNDPGLATKDKGLDAMKNF